MGSNVHAYPSADMVCVIWLRRDSFLAFVFRGVVRILQGNKKKGFNVIIERLYIYSCLNLYRLAYLALDFSNAIEKEPILVSQVSLNIDNNTHICWIRYFLHILDRDFTMGKNSFLFCLP